MNSNFKRSAQGGFTLIELIVVIVILGILAATALPKFIDLGKDAREASVKGVRGAMNSASALVHGKWLVKAENPVVVDGGSISVNTAGFPDGAGIVAAASLSASDYTITTTATTVTVSPKGLTTAIETAGSCTVTYTIATGVATVPDTLVCG
ncbi:type II secretion system protein [Massilia sp. MS-15]|uniref:type II secretion system protein n=1 Tax=Massilia sp. MS-15 TaxID=2878200 RepID=UPI0027D971D4|nr:type II secretion system protein [Massilia sp. MS-15]